MSTAGLMLLTPRLRPRSTRPRPPQRATARHGHGAVGAHARPPRCRHDRGGEHVVGAPAQGVRRELVPAVAAVGTPQGKPAPALPPRPEEPAPRVSQRTARELPERETRKPRPRRRPTCRHAQRACRTAAPACRTGACPIARCPRGPPQRRARAKRSCRRSPAAARRHVPRRRPPGPRAPSRRRPRSASRRARRRAPAP